jgi:hypothetical protein
MHAEGVSPRTALALGITSAVCQSTVDDWFAPADSDAIR